MPDQTSSDGVQRGVRIIHSGLHCAILLASTMLTSITAIAQEAGFPPVRPSQDTNGVDLFRGNLTTKSPVLSMGQAPGGLIYYQSGATDTVTAFIHEVGMGYLVPGISKIYVTIGEVSYSFNPSGGQYISTEADGATLTLSGGIYKFTSPEGLVSRFDRSINKYYFSFNGDKQFYAIDVTRPNGEKLSYTYDHYEKCVQDLMNPPCSIQHWYRRKSVNSNFNYQIDFDHETDDYPDTNIFWLTETGASMKNTNSGALSTMSWLNTYDNGASIRTITDSIGRNTVYRTTGITEITKSGSSSPDIVVSYTSDGRVASFSTVAGAMSYAYADAGGVRTTTVTDPLSHTTTYRFDIASERLVSTTDATGRTTSYQYDSNGRITQISYPEGNALKYTYDARGNVTATRRVAKSGSGLADIVTLVGYDATCTNYRKCNSPNWTRDGKGNQTDYSYSPTTGDVLAVTSPAANLGGVRPVTTYNYSTVNGVSILSSVSRCQTSANCAGTADEAKTNITYNTNGLPITYTETNGNGSLAATTTFGYDAMGNRASVDGPLAGTGDTTFYRYNAARELTGVIGPDPDGAGARKRTAMRNTYDARGRIISAETGTVTDASDTAWNNFAPQQQVATTYDKADRPLTRTLSAGGATYSSKQYSYDHHRLDQVKQVMSGNGSDRIAKYGYDAMDRQTKMTDAYGTAQQSDQSTATYTNNGRIASVTDAEGNKTSYEYDGHDRLAKTIYPSATKGSGTSNALDYQQFVYDANDNVTSRRLRDGTSIIYGLDNLDRLTTKNLPGTEPDITYTHDLIGRTTSTTQGTHILSFTYDALDRNLTQTGVQGTIAYSYDAAGRRTSMAYPGSALTINYDYDVAGNITRIRENSATSGVGVLASYAYDNLGRRTSITFGNGSVQSFSFDPVSRLSTLTNNLGGPATTHDLTQTFAYNPAGQVTNVGRNNDAYAWTAHYNVDRNYTLDGLNRITGAGGLVFSYDAHGNLTSDGASNFTYTSENLLKTGPASATLGYDPLGRLFQTVGGGITTRFQYDGTDLIAEYNASNVVQRRYVHGPGIDNPIVWYEGSAVSNVTRRFLMADERGSVTSITDSTGATVGLNSYDEYGIPAPTNIGRFGYTGQRWVPEIGMWYYKARIYSPTLGRFLQTDPIGYNDGLNWYNYVGSDPVNKVDPMGTEIVVSGIGGGGGGGGGASLGLEMNSLGLGLNAFMMVHVTPPATPTPPTTKKKPDTKDRTKEYLKRLAELKKQIQDCPPPASSAQCKPLWDEYTEILNAPEMKIVKQKTAETHIKLLVAAFSAELGVLKKGPWGGASAAGASGLGLWFDEIWAWANGYD